MVRYFEDATEIAAKSTRLVCKKCGTEREHKTASCPHIIVSVMQNTDSNTT